MKNKKAFTLIELIAVLVILAILALIVTPIVLSIVKRAKESANKRSVDAYGKSIELAVANYLLDKGEFPTNISDLEIEYSGKEVICNISLLNEDSSVYLSECKVGNSDVKDKNTSDGWYHYGKKTTYKAYKIGDEVTYNGINFYVIENSDENSDSVTLLKEEPLKKGEVDLSSTEIANKVSYDGNNYLKMAYYSKDTCVTVGDAGCKTDYNSSNIKQVVDVWSNNKLKSSDLKEDKTGYSARLITYNELIDNLGYGDNGQGTIKMSQNGETPSWVYNSNYLYWTMSQYEDSTSYVWRVDGDGDVYYDAGMGRFNVDDGGGTVRPVITLLKSAI